MNFRSVVLAAAVVVSVIASPASAAQRLLRLFGDAEARFVLPASPTPSAFDFDFFAIYNTVGNVNGFDDGFDLYFYIAGSGGGFDAQGVGDPNNLLQLSGPSVFTGPVTAPTFVNGSYTLVDYNNGLGNYTLVISEVPEPASWAMMIAGFGLSGAAMRRRRVVAA